MSLSEAEAAFDHPVLELETLAEMFERSAERNGDTAAQQYKGGIYDRSLAGDGDAAPLEPAPEGEYASITYDDMAGLVRRIAAGFRDLGIADGERVGIFADTRMEWALSDFGILAAGGVVTTVYKSSSPNQIRYLLDDPDASGVVVENETLLERVLAVEDELDLEFYVVFDALENDAYADREDVITLGDLYRRGDEGFDRSKYESWLATRDVDDLASLIYTSGTTGKPKGVKLTHRNLRSNVTQLYRRYGPRDDKDEDDPSITPESRALSVLPLAHVFERTAGHFMLFAAGACIAYGESPETFAEDLGAVGATSTTAVPRVYEKLYDGIRENAARDEDTKEALEWAFDVARRYNAADDPDEELETELQQADELVFATIREKLGGNVEFLVSGGGSLSPDLCRLFHAMGLPILEGYGMTETSPVIATNPPSDPRVGTVGPSLSDVETKLDTSVVRDEDFDDEGTVGELLVKGPNVTAGYWEKPGATDRAFTETGWLRTGDIVHERPDGYLEFRERTKQLLVLSTGKNVAPGPLEDAFASIDVVEQAMVVGDGEKFVGALLVPTVDELRSRAASEGVSLPEEIEALVENEWVLERVQAAVDDVNEGFESYETIKEFRLVPEGFTEENDLVTPTMKKRRSKIAERYAHLVEDIYAGDHAADAGSD
ncbi:long-chain fatty acid--CoA ligase [Haloterrigena sp. SYSU A121-1]|uniref:Long-chain fatty acid--CoA ligase n=1 Tax=Haloterrigena gelatinilytica TaxID=2741724 RepID=A0A8J8GQW9_9EURY|nr:long-chain fatty acid--CoA ligase [Haloterrigena gelatinilytica]NUB92814.1 long-chain fatty acid--CoA ligase [Haloterrigena gelatinilytica]